MKYNLGEFIKFKQSKYGSHLFSPTRVGEIRYIVQELDNNDGTILHYYKVRSDESIYDVYESEILGYFEFKGPKV